MTKKRARLYRKFYARALLQLNLSEKNRLEAEPASAEGG